MFTVSISSLYEFIRYSTALYAGCMLIHIILLSDVCTVSACASATVKTHVVVEVVFLLLLKFLCFRHKLSFIHSCMNIYIRI